MASVTSSSSKPLENDVPIEEIVFSCSICQATVSEVYATTESNNGFHSGSDDEDGIITKFWITECSHITCAKHLENGAAPFHPKGMPPRAPCPKCLKDKGDDKSRSLYGIRGLGDGEYDAMIPTAWLRCPAMKLDSSTPEMAAVRFQYMALVHYSLEVRKHWKSAQEKHSLMEAACSKERNQRRQLQSELQALQQRVDTLEKREEEWKKWEDRKPMITHYLGAIGRMSSEMDGMRQRLLDFGVVVPKTEYTFAPPRTSIESYLSPSQTAPTAAAQNRKSNAASALSLYEQENSSSTRKRKREEGGADQFQHENGQAQRLNGGSRDLMPPPLPKPKQQQRRVNDFPAVRASSAMLRPPSRQNKIQVYGDNVHRSSQTEAQRNQPSFGRQQPPMVSAVTGETALPYRPVLIDGNGPRSNAREVPAHVASRGEVEARFRRPEMVSDYAGYQSAQNRMQLQRHQPIWHLEANNNRGFGASQRSAGALLHPQTPSNGFVNAPRLQQHSEVVRTPLRTLSEFETNRHFPVTLRAQLPAIATTGHQDSSLPGPPQSSPFFRQEGRGAIPLFTQQPPTRGGFSRTQHGTLLQNGTVARNSASRTYAHQGSYGPPRTSGHLTQRANHASTYNPPFRRPDIAAQYQPKTPVPQTPRNSQGLFHRPDYSIPAMSHPVSKPQANTIRSRVSLPPNYGPQMPMAINPDQALLHVPGVRGLSSQNGPPSYQRVNSAYGAPRTLFSSVGGRRSVLR